MVPGAPREMAATVPGAPREMAATVARLDGDDILRAGSLLAGFLDSVEERLVLEAGYPLPRTLGPFVRADLLALSSH